MTMEIIVRRDYTVNSLMVTVQTVKGNTTAYVRMPELDFSGPVDEVMNRLAALRDGINAIINEVG